MKSAFIDLETTGVNPFLHGIHQISGIIEIDGKEKESFNFKVKPFEKDIVDLKALEIANVSIETIQTYEEPKKVYNQLTSLLGKHVSKYDKTDKLYFIGFNSTFDFNFLREFFVKNSDTYFGSWFWNPSIDIWQLINYKISFLDNARLKVPNMNLKACAEYLGIDLSGRVLHDALDDIILTKEVFDKLKGEVKI
jgi:DNA polymerase III subunit epsilon